MVDVPAGAEPEAGDVPLPVLRPAPARDERSSAHRSRRRHRAPPPRARRVRAGRARRRPLPAARRLAGHAAETAAVLAILTVNAGSTSLKLHVVDGETSRQIETMEDAGNVAA